MEETALAGAFGHRKVAISLLSISIGLVLFSFFLRDLGVILFQSTVSFYGEALSLLLILILLFGSVHIVSYLDNLLKSIFVYSKQDWRLRHQEGSSPRVAIFIPVYNENPGIVEDCIRACKANDYPDFEVFLLDDSTDESLRNANMRLCEQHGATFIYRGHRRGFKAGAINDAMHTLNEETKYVLVVDADHAVKPQILSNVVPILEQKRTVSFLQIPQYFIANNGDAISNCFSYQQHIFNKHICRGLHVRNSVLLTGSNTLYRLDHLKEIGGMSESCITEDVATTFVYNIKGYTGVFLDRVYAEGASPPTLSAYYTQQTRWAYGNTHHLKTVFLRFLQDPRALTPYQWLGYFLNGTNYFFGPMSLILLLFPATILLFNIRIASITFPSIFVGFLVFELFSQFTSGMLERKYHAMDLFKAQAIFTGVSLIYTRAVLYAILGKKMGFSVTPKIVQRSEKRSMNWLIGGLLLLSSVTAASAVMGLWKLLQGVPTTQYSVAFFWTVYNLLFLVTFLVLHIEESKKLAGVAGVQTGYVDNPPG